MEGDATWKGNGSYLDLLHSILNYLPSCSKKQNTTKSQNPSSLPRESHLQSDSAAASRLQCTAGKHSHGSGNAPENAKKI